MCALSPVRVFQVLNALMDHANKPRKTAVSDMKELQNTNQLEKKQFPKDLALVGCTTLRSVTLTIAGWECYILFLPPVGKPKQKVTSVFPGFFRKENSFCLDPQKKRAVLVVAARKKKSDSWKLRFKRGPPRCPGCGAGHGTSRSGDSATSKCSDFLVNRKPHHKKNMESHLVHTFYHSVFLLTFNVMKVSNLFRSRKLSHVSQLRKVSKAQ